MTNPDDTIPPARYEVAGLDPGHASPFIPMALTLIEEAVQDQDYFQIGTVLTTFTDIAVKATTLVDDDADTVARKVADLATVIDFWLEATR